MARRIADAVRTGVFLALALALGTGCTTVAPPMATPPHAATLISQAPPPIRRADIIPTDIERAIQAEAAIEMSSKVPLQPGEPWFMSAVGTRRVIVSAPHATAPLREGKRRFTDGPGTAALAQSLHALCGSTVIYTTREGPSDPNYYDDNDYKRELARLIAEQSPLLVLDIHGSHPSRPYDVDFGTMHGASLLGRGELVVRLAEQLRAEGLMNLSDNFFAASGKETVTKFASRLGVPAIQLEISATRLQPGRGCDTTKLDSCGSLDTHRFAQMLQGLMRYLEGLGQCHRATAAAPVTTPVSPTQ